MCCLCHMPGTPTSRTKERGREGEGEEEGGRERRRDKEGRAGNRTEDEDSQNSPPPSMMRTTAKQRCLVDYHSRGRRASMLGSTARTAQTRARTAQARATPANRSCTCSCQTQTVRGRGRQGNHSDHAVIHRSPSKLWSTDSLQLQHVSLARLRQ